MRTSSFHVFRFGFSFSKNLLKKGFNLNGLFIANRKKMLPWNSIAILLKHLIYQTKNFFCFHILCTFFCSLVHMIETKIMVRFFFYEIIRSYNEYVSLNIKRKRKRKKRKKNQKIKKRTTNWKQLLFVPNCDRKIQKYCISNYEEEQIQGQEARELFIRHIRHGPDTLLTTSVQCVIIDFGDDRWALGVIRELTVVATATGTGPSWSWPFGQRWQIDCDDVMGIVARWGLQLMLRMHVEFICEPWRSRFIQIIHFMTLTITRYRPRMI